MSGFVIFNADRSKSATYTSPSTWTARSFQQARRAAPSACVTGSCGSTERGWPVKATTAQPCTLYPGVMYAGSVPASFDDYTTYMAMVGSRDRSTGKQQRMIAGAGRADRTYSPENGSGQLNVYMAALDDLVVNRTNPKMQDASQGAGGLPYTHTWHDGAVGGLRYGGAAQSMSTATPVSMAYRSCLNTSPGAVGQSTMHPSGAKFDLGWGKGDGSFKDMFKDKAAQPTMHPSQGLFSGGLFGGHCSAENGFKNC